MNIVDFLSRSPLKAFGDTREGLTRDLVAPFTALDLDASEPILICTHKGFLDRTPLPFLRQATGASRVAHADEVFVVFEVEGVACESALVEAYRTRTHAALRPASIRHDAPASRALSRATGSLPASENAPEQEDGAFRTLPVSPRMLVL